MKSSEFRQHVRRRTTTSVSVNEGIPYRGGTLYDISVGGLAVTYPEDTRPSDTPVEIGETLFVYFGDETRMPCQIVRISEDGFAAKIDFSLSL